jgi:putative salt-induced outer membrane protein YdiY
MLRRVAFIWGLIIFCACSGQVATAQPLFAPPGALPSPSSQTSPTFAAPPLPTTTATGVQAPTPAGGSVAETLPLPSETTAPIPTDELLPELKALVPAEEPGWYAPRHWLSPSPWETSIEFGLNGSSGTSESLSLQTGATVLRESRFSKLILDSKYNRTTKGGTETQNNAELDVRNDWLLDDESPWTLYATGNVFYDQFQAFNLQSSANSGLGYRFIHKPELEFLGRFGAGTSREFGGPDDRWVPESLIGVEYTQRLSALQKLTAKVDYYPEWDQVGEFRLLADVAWETALVQPSNISLKISASDRYDSTPSGADPHLVNYSVLLLIKM